MLLYLLYVYIDLPKYSEIGSGMKDKPLLSLEALVKSLELRFRYHFEGDRQTNRIDKVCFLGFDSLTATLVY